MHMRARLFCGEREATDRNGGDVQGQVHFCATVAVLGVTPTLPLGASVYE